MYKQAEDERFNYEPAGQPPDIGDLPPIAGARRWYGKTADKASKTRIHPTAGTARDQTIGIAATGASSSRHIGVILTFLIAGCLCIWAAFALGAWR